MPEVNLKYILMELGNRLVADGFDPGRSHRSSEGIHPLNQSTQAIVNFTEFLNAHPEAVAILEDMGVQWPTTLEQRRAAEFAVLQEYAHQTGADIPKKKGR